MTLRWIEGFDGYYRSGTSSNNGFSEYLSSIGWIPNNNTGYWVSTDKTRFNSGYAVATDLYGIGWKVLDDITEGIVGFAFNQRTDQLSYTDRIKFVHISPAGIVSHCSVTLANTSLGLNYNPANTSSDNLQSSSYTAPGVYRLNSWNYCEIGFKIHATDGYLHVRMNGAPVASIEGVRTLWPQAPTAVCNGIGFLAGGAVSTLYLDDVYLVDRLGTTNNDFLGEVRVRTLTPSAAGDSTTWQPVGTTENWQAAASYDLNQAHYNFTDTAGAYDLYQCGNLPTNSAIYGIQVSGMYAHGDAIVHTARNIIKTGGTIYEGSLIHTPASLAAFSSLWEVNPNTGVGWTKSDIDALQIGPKMIT
jgi:hypothetical protein